MASTLNFPPRPIPTSKNIYEDEFEKLGLPSHAAILRSSLDIDRAHLAKTLIQISNDMKQGATPVQTTDVPRVVNVLLDLSDAFLDLIMRNELHKIFKTPTKPQLRLPNQHHVALSGKERPRCYAVVQCNSNGVPPSKRNYLEAIRYMKDYIREPLMQSAWPILDYLAKSIDYHSPPNRDWNGESSGMSLLKWTEVKGVKIDHPRRYCRNPSQRSQIKEWIDEMEKRLAKINDLDEPLPWSVAYIGWTRCEKSREKDHEHHLGDASQVKFLLESVMVLKIAPKKNFVMHFVPLLAVVDPNDVGIAEHSLSILAGSYTWWGGLNGSMAGAGGCVTTAKKYGSDVTWSEGSRQSIAQNVYTPNVAKLQKDLEMREFLGNHLKPGSELESLRLIQRSRKDAQDAVDKMYRQGGEMISTWAKLKKQKLEAELLEMDLDGPISDLREFREMKER